MSTRTRVHIANEKSDLFDGDSVTLSRTVDVIRVDLNSAELQGVGHLSISIDNRLKASISTNTPGATFFLDFTSAEIAGITYLLFHIDGKKKAVINVEG